MNVWRLKTHHEEPALALAWIKLHNRIAIGWGGIGDMAEKQFDSADQIAAAIRAAYPGLGNSGDGGASLWRLFNEAQPGDLVILSGERAREFVVEITGGYEWSTDVPLDSSDYNHQRRVQKRYLNPDKLWHLAGAAHAPGQSPRGTLFRMARELCNADFSEAGM